MNKVIKNSFLVLALLSVLFTSCKKEYENPPVNNVPIGTVLTIDTILQMPTNTPFEQASVFGIVTADEQSGNLYKTIFIQDRGSGKAIELRLNASSAARAGDSVRVCLDSTIVFSYYNNLPQLSGLNDKGFSPDGHLVIYPFNRPIEPKVLTIAEIMSGDYIGALVKLDSVEFVEKNVTFCDAGETTNRHLVDASSPNSNDNFVVRTSNYANFAYDYMPISKGSLVAIVSIYKSTYQLLLTSKKDMNFAVWGNPAAPAGDLQTMPYLQAFDADFGTYTTYNVEGAQIWTIKYSSAWISGHEGGGGGADYANEDWLISSPVAITNVEHAKAVVNYAAAYTPPVDADVTLQVSTDYEFGKDPKAATWTELPERFDNNSTSSNWVFTDKEVNLDQFIGKEIYFAVKFLSTTNGSRTFEIKSINITEGEAGTGGGGGGGVTPPSTDPITVAEGISQQDQTPYVTAWVQGYIVGAVKKGPTSVSSNEDIDWTAPFTRATNVLISDDPNCHDVANCIIIELGSTTMKSQVNLTDHPENYGKKLSVLGTLRKYFGQAGLRDCPGTESDFVLEGGGTPTPPTPGNAIFSETFASGQGQFTIKDVTVPAGLNEIWAYQSGFKCMKANGFSGGAKDSESWLISPTIDLTNVSAATLTFDHAANFANPQGSFFVMVSWDYSNDVTAANWTELNVSAWPDYNSNWTFTTATADLSAAVGKTVTIAFKYTSSTSVCPAWEVKNFVVE